jgi:aspartate dehydrogenase
MSHVTKVALIGFGAIGRTLAEALRAQEGLALTGILERADIADRVAGDVQAGVKLVTKLDALLALGPDVVVECAGHQALRDHGEAVLRHGVPLLVASVGALADAGLEASLRAAAGSRARLLIPAGAIGGLDVLGAAKHAGIASVDYTGRKAPKAWRGTRAEALINLDSVTEAQVFFEGDARSAALAFPQNANVVAAVALAGVGFEKTRVRLMVDPSVSTNQHAVKAVGEFGEIAVQITARTLPRNPKTSMLAPYSLIRTLRNLADAVSV